MDASLLYNGLLDVLHAQATLQKRQARHNEASSRDLAALTPDNQSNCQCDSRSPRVEIDGDGASSVSEVGNLMAAVDAGTADNAVDVMSEAMHLLEEVLGLSRSWLWTVDAHARCGVQRACRPVVSCLIPFCLLVLASQCSMYFAAHHTNAPVSGTQGGSRRPDISLKGCH